MSGHKNVDKSIEDWLNWDKNPKTLNEIRSLVASESYDELSKRMLKRMEFGTAGLRAAMGAGFSRINDLTIIQTSQGLLQYLLKEFSNLKTAGVVIGYDARHGSQRFARLTAAIFLHAGVKVYLFSDIVCTPFVPFSVVKYSCVAGVMVTASHNPKEDNGYKVYYSNGAQIIPPHDSGISNCINECLTPCESSWDEMKYATSHLCIDPLDEVWNDYMKSIQAHCHNRACNGTSPLNITYTAMHGVGERFEIDAFKAFSLKPFYTTPAQAKPDPDFPTVTYPNPEEGKGALKLAIETADANNSPFIIANDPDADRLAIAEKLPDGAWKIFSGNETALLLGWWAMYNHKEKHPEDFQGDKVYMVYSTVSSRALKSMGEIEGFKTEETLTGFKWIANKSIDLQKQGKIVLFGFEEAIGFMFGTQVLDKDGVSAGAVVSEMACLLYKEKQTVSGKLEELYSTYGLLITNNSYFICHDQATIKRIFERIRTLCDGKYPHSIGPFKVLHVRDLYGDGFDSSRPHNKPVLPTSSSGQMVTFTCDQGCVATIRTSGTEPKIKYYSEIATDPSKKMNRVEAQSKINSLISHLVEELLEPAKNNLIARTE